MSKTVGTTEDGRTVYATPDPKFVIIDNELCNHKTHEPVTCPVFMLLAKDWHASQAMWEYGARCRDEDHKDAVAARIMEFQQWKSDHLERMKEPDTDLPYAGVAEKDAGQGTARP